MKKIIVSFVCLFTIYAVVAQNKYGTYTIVGGDNAGVYNVSDKFIEGIRQYNPAAANALERGQDIVFTDSRLGYGPHDLSGCDYQDWSWLVTAKDYMKWDDGRNRLIENARISRARAYVDNLHFFNPYEYIRVVDMSKRLYLQYGIVEGKVKVLPNGDYDDIKWRIRGYLNWNWYRDEKGFLPGKFEWKYSGFTNMAEADKYTNSIRHIINNPDFWQRLEEGTLTEEDVTILEKYNIYVSFNFDRQQKPVINKGQYQSSGSGFFLTTNGVIVTNYHVVEEVNGIDVFVNRNGEVKIYKANVLISDKTNDISLLKIDDDSFTPFATLPYIINTQILDVGTSVFALGYPMSDILGEEIKLTNGLISSKTGYQGDIVTYQISAPIQPGNSGGPLFDKNGNIVGITNAGVPDAQNVGYAIKASYLRNLVDVAPETVTLPVQNNISGLSFTEKVKRLTPYVVLIKVY